MCTRAFEKTGTDGFVAVDYQIIKGKSCPIRILGDSAVQSVDFVAGGLGTAIGDHGPLYILSSYMGAEMELMVQLVLQRVAQNLDFAILKKKNIESTPCVRFSQDSDTALTDMKIWSLSYPAKTGWVSDDLSDGKTQLVSQGKILESYRDFPELKKYAEQVPMGGGEFQQKKRDFFL